MTDIEKLQQAVVKAATAWEKHYSCQVPQNKHEAVLLRLELRNAVEELNKALMPTKVLPPEGTLLGTYHLVYWPEGQEKYTLAKWLGGEHYEWRLGVNIYRGERLYQLGARYYQRVIIALTPQSNAPTTT